MVRATGATVGFSRMDRGTAEDYALVREVFSREPFDPTVVASDADAGRSS